MNKTYCPECSDLWQRVTRASLRVDTKVNMVRQSRGHRVSCAMIVPGTAQAESDLRNARQALALHQAREH